MKFHVANFEKKKKRRIQRKDTIKNKRETEAPQSHLRKIKKNRRSIKRLFKTLFPIIIITIKDDEFATSQKTKERSHWGPQHSPSHTPRQLNGRRKVIDISWALLPLPQF